ncbi:ABC transporter permease [Irregularibacter muris]|uniref:ABC transporter permease n=1 Tax=Irregularibacter muris TaxID=1796619 RepID=A0AAE3HG65_9FIRM|nr:ABC transporter permease [Irregularibacter muris]MCR1899561.1 ABC transporter permease [Irregularibacter muris]
MLSFIMYMLTSTIRMGTPIAFTALGGVMSERSGVVNIGLEGIMLASAFGAVIGSYLSGNAWVGILVAILLGVFISAIHSMIAITWGGNQSVSSMALISLATGFSGVGLQAIFKQQGSSPRVANMASTPILKGIPVIGDFLASLSPLVYLALVALFVVHYIFKKTPLGLRIITVGENPRAAETAGISVHKIRYLCVIASGILGGLGGAFLSIGHMNLFQEGMVAGRGYLALGAVTMGRWTPLGSFASAMLFGFFEAVQLYVQTIPNNPIPSEFIQMIPYVASLVILTGALKKESDAGISSSGKPYTKYVQQR